MKGWKKEERMEEKKEGQTQAHSSPSAAVLAASACGFAQLEQARGLDGFDGLTDESRYTS